MKTLIWTGEINRERICTIHPSIPGTMSFFVHLARNPYSTVRRVLQATNLPVPDSVLLEVFTIMLSRISHLRKRFGKTPFWSLLWFSIAFLLVQSCLY